ncbi:MAG: hypothetical protein PWR14_812 [Thermosediminibacterales bacterium]|jgi:DNA repair exonuclease SbcCD ATPase subunit|nr:hypothetical protein [Thermosediminibacterales bacterium]
MSKINGEIIKKIKELYGELDNLYESFFELVKIEYIQLTEEKYEELLKTLSKKEDLINKIEKINHKLKELDKQFNDFLKKEEVFQVCEYYKKNIGTKILEIKAKEDENKKVLNKNIKKIKDDIDYIKKGRKTLHAYNFSPNKIEPRFIDKKR